MSVFFFSHHVNAVILQLHFVSVSADRCQKRKSFLSDDTCSSDVNSSSDSCLRHRNASTTVLSHTAYTNVSKVSAQLVFGILSKVVHSSKAIIGGALRLSAE